MVKCLWMKESDRYALEGPTAISTHYKEGKVITTKEEKEAFAKARANRKKSQKTPIPKQGTEMTVITVKYIIYIYFISKK